MARAAGNSGTYELVIVDGAGAPKGRAAQLTSVTTILKALPKFGLDWWGMKIGVKGVLDLLGANELHDLLDPKDDLDARTERVYAAIKEKKAHTPRTALEAAGGRGTDVHDIAESLFTTGQMPDRDSVPEEQRGYAQALYNWWTHLNDSHDVEVIAVEVPLFSLQHEFAGTVDLILKVGEVYHIIDFKTSKAIYESHLLQTVAYAHAAIERGYVPLGALTRAVVVRLGADGKPEVQEADKDLYRFEDFLAVQAVKAWLDRLEEAKARKRVAKPRKTTKRKVAS